MATKALGILFASILFLGVPVRALAQEELRTIQHNGERKFRVFLPSHYTKDKKLPMVLVFHGGGGSIDGTVRMTGMDQTAEKRGFVAVYPAGSGPREDQLLTWNAGSCCAYAMEKNIDDVGFVSKMIDFLIAEYNIDHRRVYATGHSNGAQISYRLVCEMADKLAAVAPHGSQGVIQECNPSRKVPIFHLHGTEDTCARYAGGECGGCFQDFFNSLGVATKRRTWSCESVEDSVKNWAIRYGCSPDPIVSHKRPMTYYSYPNCPDDVIVKLGAVNGSGHTWPGGNYALESCRSRPSGRLCKRWKETVGPIISDININELMWDFFTKFSLPK